MDVIFINFDYMPICLVGTSQLLITLIYNMELFQKNHNRCILDTEKKKYVTKKVKNTPTLLLFHGEKL